MRIYAAAMLIYAVTTLIMKITIIKVTWIFLLVNNSLVSYDR